MRCPPPAQSCHLAPRAIADTHNSSFAEIGFMDSPSSWASIHDWKRDPRRAAGSEPGPAATGSRRSHRWAQGGRRAVVQNLRRRRAERQGPAIQGHPRFAQARPPQLGQAGPPSWTEWVKRLLNGESAVPAAPADAGRITCRRSPRGSARGSIGGRACAPRGCAASRRSCRPRCG